MKLYFAVLIIFLLAFAGLATGLILKRKGLRGGCRPAPGTDRDCRCKSATKPNLHATANRYPKADEGHEE